MSIEPEYPPVVLLSHAGESSAFRRLQWQLLRTRLAQGFAASRLRYALVVLLSVALWLGLFHLEYKGFLFMRATLSLRIHEQVVQGIFSFFFLALFLMLVFSAAVILYGSLFRSREVAYLLTLPVREERIFQHQFQYTVLLSSWGFLLMGSPMLVAYGMVVEAPWYYYAMLLPLLLAFVYIPAGVGAILLLAIMHFFPRRRVQVLGLAVLATIALTVWFFWSIVARPETELFTSGWFTEMLHRLQLTQEKPLPNWWLSTAVLESAGGAWSEGVMFLVLLVANALFFRELAGLFAAWTYRRAYWAAAGIGTRPARVQMGWFDRSLNFCLGFLNPQVRLIVLKDLRIFRRDPLQWSQFVILAGLLLMYFINVRPVGSHQRFSQWVNLVSFMNLSVVGLLMSTFTTRFVFPTVSLEGRRFWLLGLLPLKRDTVLWAKFLFSTGSLLFPCGLLILLSDLRLGVPAMLTAEHQLTSLLLCLGLSGIAVGLGARLPVMNEQSPSRIAAGFGGTLNLVVSTLFILLVLVLATLPYHIYFVQKLDVFSALGCDFLPPERTIRPWFIYGTIASIFVGAMAVLLPMWIGIRTFRRQEFQ